MIIALICIGFLCHLASTDLACDDPYGIPNQ